MTENEFLTMLFNKGVSAVKVDGDTTYLSCIIKHKDLNNNMELLARKLHMAVEMNKPDLWVKRHDKIQLKQVELNDFIASL